jgi:hypothetical protein
VEVFDKNRRSSRDKRIPKTKFNSGDERVKRGRLQRDYATNGLILEARAKKPAEKLR